LTWAIGSKRFEERIDKALNDGKVISMLRQRVITAAAGVLLVVGATIAGGWWLAALFAAIAAVSTVEFGAMIHLRLWTPEAIIALAFTLLVVLVPSFQPYWYLVLYLLLVLSIARRQAFSFTAAGTLFAGVLYVSYAWRTMLDLRAQPHGLDWVLLVFIAIWMTDTGAYFVGRALGGRKLMPDVSPKKTVSGAIGGVVFAMLATTLAGIWLIPAVRAEWPLLAVLGLVISVAGEAGDLVESGLKRHYQVKDSGWMLPGHGGMLDRFDSLLLAAPIAYHLVMWLFVMH